MAALLVLLIAPVLTFARELDVGEVGVAVQTWVRYVTADARPDAVIDRMEPYENDGRTVAFIAHFEGGGFCLCGADNLVLPVYFYNPNGIYDADNPELSFILREIEERTITLTQWERNGNPELERYESIFAERDLFWQDLIARRIPDRMTRPKSIMLEPDSMSINVTSEWDQGSPYNALCPVLTPATPAETTIVGCGATSLTQIMYFWKWPNTGESIADLYYKYRSRATWDEEPLATDPGIPGNWGGGGRLLWSSSGGGKLQMNGRWDNSVYGEAQDLNDDAAYLAALETLWNRLDRDSTLCSVNFGATSYNWSIMEDTHVTPPDTPGDFETAKICYHGGVAIGMSYGIWGSAVGYGHFPDALKDHFRYDPDAIHESEPIDIEKMTEEIEWLRPFDLNGSDTSGAGGHFWVVHGYNKATDPDRQFKMNMGWGGSSNGWYSADLVDAGSYVFATHSYTTHIAPESVVRFVGDRLPGDGSPANPYENIEAAIADSADIPDGATLIFRAGSDNTFSADSIIIDFPVTLKARGATIREF